MEQIVEDLPLKQSSQDVKSPLLTLPPWQLRSLIFIYLHCLLYGQKDNIDIASLWKNCTVRENKIFGLHVQYHSLLVAHLYPLLSSGSPSTLSGSVC